MIAFQCQNCFLVYHYDDIINRSDTMLTLLRFYLYCLFLLIIKHCLTTILACCINKWHNSDRIVWTWWKYQTVLWLIQVERKRFNRTNDWWVGTLRRVGGEHWAGQIFLERIASLKWKVSSGGWFCVGWVRLMISQVTRTLFATPATSLDHACQAKDKD